MTDLTVLAAAEPPCTGVDTDLFFPTPGTSAADAKSVCALCPVRSECLQYALDVPQYGVWGGTTTSERAEIAREMARPYNPDWTPSTAGPASGEIKPESARRRELRAGAPRRYNYGGTGGHDRMLADVKNALARGLSRGQIEAELGIYERTLRDALNEISRQQVAS